jgi:hypothetical protein
MEELRARALPADENRDALLVVELISGDREMITAQGIGQGVDLICSRMGSTSIRWGAVRRSVSGSF